MEETRLGLIKHWENKTPRQEEVEVIDGVEYVNTIEGLTKKEDMPKIEYIYDEKSEEVISLTNGEIVERYDCEKIEASYGELKPYTKFRLDKLRKNPYAYIVLHIEGDMDEYIETATLYYIEKRNEAYADLKSKKPELSHEELESLADEFIFNMDSI